MNPNASPSMAASAPDLAVVEPALADVTETPPAGFAHSALVAVGLADDYTVLDSPIGPLWIAWNGRGVAAVESAPDDRAFEVRFQARTGRPIRRVEALPAALARAIERRLGGDRRARISLDYRGTTEFEQAVWLKALEIPRGEVRPYGWIAAEIGRPKAVRAVGTALGHNPFPPILPCPPGVPPPGANRPYSLG